MKLKTLLLAAIFLATNLVAHEGMWIPTLLNAIEDEMQAEGLKLSAEDIYSVNNSSLKDAIVHFGGGCTAEVISDEGLILTNYHCGYSQVQSHSSVENDYLTGGFWASKKSDELNNAGLTATFIVSIEDVTEQVLAGISIGKTPAERDALFQKVAEKIESESVKGTKYKAKVRAFYYGSEYYMITTKTYEDVRLVGAPPSSIGKFGGDTDNWIWPRHTGDFALFRIYADANNEPAKFDELNKPYKPSKSLEISVKGIEEGDFTMVYGFPGVTSNYLTSYDVDYIQNLENPAKIAMREKTLGIMASSMDSDDKIRIQYAAKQSRVSNAWKKWIGQNFGLKQQKVLDKKRAAEKDFQEKVDGSSNENRSLLSDFEKKTKEISKYKMARAMFIEYLYYGPEIVRFINRFDNLIANYDKLEASGDVEKEREKLLRRIDSFFKDFHQPTDLLIFNALTDMYVENVDNTLLPLSLRDKVAKKTLSTDLYNKSIFSNKDKLKSKIKTLNSKSASKLKSDPGFKFSKELFTAYFTAVRPEYARLNAEFSVLMKDYINIQKELYPDRKFSPDANSTLRLTYGKAEGSNPRDAVHYKYYSTAEGVLAKYEPESKDFDLPKDLITLLESKDYGQYADKNGDLRVCFTGSNHTSGGNSGSPALNAEGQLVGLNFDRSWESTMSDIMFSEELCRNIMVDIRYVLFVIDKYAGAKHLIEEMNISQ